MTRYLTSLSSSLLLTYASSFVAGCSGTETGNPIIAELAVDAHSSAPERIAIRSAAGGAIVDEAWLSLAPMSFNDDCAAPLDAADVPALGVGDHADEGALRVMFELTAARYCELVVALAPVASAPDGAPAAMVGHAVYLQGRAADGTPFTLASPLDDDFRVRALREQFELDASQRALFLGFDVAAWFRDIDLADAARVDGVIVIDTATNSDLLAAFESSFASGLELYRDRNGDGSLDPPDDALIARGR